VKTKTQELKTRWFLAKEVMRGHPVMFRITVKNGTVTIGAEQHHTSIVQCNIINEEEVWYDVEV
jgi:heat shock protein HslJ